MTKDTGTAILFIVIAVCGMWSSQSFNELSSIFPVIILWIFLVLSVLYLVSSVIFSRQTEENKIFTKEFLIISISLFAYVFLIWITGFIIASLLFLGIATWHLQADIVSGRRRIINSVLSSVLVTSVFFIIFRYVLLVPLPGGIFS